MPKLIPCPDCHKPISADSDACPSCGRPAPDGGWPEARRPSGWEKFGVGLVGMAVVAGALALIVTGGHVHQTETTAAPAAWSPHVGASARLRADTVSCPSNRLFDALHDKLAALRVKAQKADGQAIGASAGIDGCFVHGRPAGSVTVLKLAVTELGVPVAKVHASNGKVWWVRRSALARLRPSTTASAAANGARTNASPRPLHMVTGGQRAD
ncbi:MAG TPA: hypothetical protein VKA76_14740 [Gammaproteobacteria bacterium]|nr:hypothetical protein [Gammaproteobacteria bacterium]